MVYEQVIEATGVLLPFLFNRKRSSLLNKTLCGAQNVRGTFVLRRPEWNGERTRAKWKFVAKATALGAGVPRAELFVKERFKQNGNFR